MLFLGKCFSFAKEAVGEITNSLWIIWSCTDQAFYMIQDSKKAAVPRSMIEFEEAPLSAPGSCPVTALMVAPPPPDEETGASVGAGDVVGDSVGEEVGDLVGA